jgi:hypothetical protein
MYPNKSNNVTRQFLAPAFVSYVYKKKLNDEELFLNKRLRCLIADESSSVYLVNSEIFFCAVVYTAN